MGCGQLNIGSREEVIRAFQTNRKSVSEKAGAKHFQGVTVQPMAPRDGYELILGSSVDPQFGPIILFGSGGELVGNCATLLAPKPPASQPAPGAATAPAGN